VSGDGGQGLTYHGAGVDRGAARTAIAAIAGLAARTRRPGVVADVGGFGGLFHLAPLGMSDPVLVAGADGVGTKLKVAFWAKRHRGVGQDLVAMSVNDVLAHGAEPLFFLDYYASGRTDPAVVAEVVAGVADGCQEAGCALLGGETAELPGMYPEGEYELAGFCVGAVERDRVIDGARVRPGDAVVGVASSGLHSNGFALARRALFDGAGLRLDSTPPELGGTPLVDELLRPTRIYVRAVLALLRAGVEVHGIAHITGGGLAENLARALAPGTGAVLRPQRWRRPPVFALIQRAGGISEDEMRRTFNIGVGMTLVLPAAAAGRAARLLADAGETAQVIGEVVAGAGVRFAD
jgi:phosphoribosylformylglycinamidine cyclo-ligase